MAIPFDTFFTRVATRTGIATQMELARALGVNRSAITQAKNRDAVPQKWLLALSRQYGISPDWLEFGTEQKRATTQPEFTATHRAPFPPRQTDTSPTDILLIPKVRALLCAGGGSLELDATPVSEHPLPRAWLSRMGNADSMVFMDVIGNSMEPSIRDGDMVLVDQSHTELTPRVVLAVGHEDAIYIKRLEKRAHGIAMLSDNPDYAPMDVVGDELASFRILGKVVWLCRDCRYV